jgi:RNA polymerase sigma-70 factor (ECF subfamily)
MTEKGAIISNRIRMRRDASLEPMKEPNRTPAIDALLAHSDWVHALARAILQDEQLAEDVTQETLVAVLRRPPRGALRPWIQVVARNLARKALRTRTRQRARDAHAARPEPAPERFTAHRCVVEAVDALDEPYRTTVVLRYFEQMAPREVARAMDVPVATVRTRLRRALPLLRTRLDVEFGGDGRRWALGLAALLAPAG